MGRKSRSNPVKKVNAIISKFGDLMQAPGNTVNVFNFSDSRRKGIRLVVEQNRGREKAKIELDIVDDNEQIYIYCYNYQSNTKQKVGLDYDNNVILYNTFETILINISEESKFKSKKYETKQFLEKFPSLQELLDDYQKDQQIQSNTSTRRPKPKSSTTKAASSTTEAVQMPSSNEAGLMKHIEDGIEGLSRYMTSKLPGSGTTATPSTTEALPPSTKTFTTTEYMLDDGTEAKSLKDIKEFGKLLADEVNKMRNGTNGIQPTNGTLGFVPELGSMNTTSGNITQFNQPGITGGVSPAAAWVAFGVMGAMTAGVVGIVGLVAAARWVTTQIMGERYTVVQDEEKQPSTSVEQPFLEPVVRTQKTVNA